MGSDIRQQNFAGLPDKAIIYTAPPEQVEGGGVRQSLKPLPVSPYLKHKKTGEIFPYTAYFAEQSDKLVNCDKHGRTEEQYWRGQKPAGWGESNEPPSVYQMPFATMDFSDLESDQKEDPVRVDTPMESTDVIAEFKKEEVKPALPISEAPIGDSVDDMIKAVLEMQEAKQ